MKTANNLIQAQQLDLDTIMVLFGLTMIIKREFGAGGERKEKLRTFLRHKNLLHLFYEPSTRTRLSFEFAASHLGMHIMGTENAKEFSSAIKGESITDTMEVLSRYHPDVIVLRHYEEGASRKAAEVTNSHGIPLINAGDGAGQHPTQALLDLFTIFERFPVVKQGIKIIMGGDLKNGRTVRSLSYLLAKFENVEIVFMSPKELKMASDILEYLERHNVKCMKYDEDDNLNDVITSFNPDVLYWTRVQKERFPDEDSYLQVRDVFTITEETMRRMKTNSILLHPLPRVNEISEKIDNDPRAWYFKQAENGLYTRMALILYLVDKQKALNLHIGK